MNNDDLLKRFLAEGRAMSRQQLETAYANACLEAEIDPLTGVYSRRHFDLQLPVEVSRAERYNHPLSLLMVDCDKFKWVNDELGHQVGDKLLADMASVFRAESRITDIVCRYGGDEFGIILPETPVEKAIDYAKRVRKGIFEYSFDEAPSGFVTVSIGISGYEAGKTAGVMVKETDTASYWAKNAGGDGFKVYAPDHSTGQNSR